MKVKTRKLTLLLQMSPPPKNYNDVGVAVSAAVSMNIKCSPCGTGAFHYHYKGHVFKGRSLSTQQLTEPTRPTVLRENTVSKRLQSTQHKTVMPPFGVCRFCHFTLNLCSVAR